MRRGGAGLIAAMLALAGCKNTGTKPPDRDTPVAPAGRSRDTTPPWLNAVGGPHPVPKANSWAETRDPNFNASAEAQGVLGGRVVDSTGRGARNVYIRVELADATDREKGGATVGIMTDANGYFQAKGLKPNRSYNLAAEAKLDGKPLYASMQAPTPNPSLTLQLRDDLAAPPPSAETPGTLPKPTTALPPPIDPTPTGGVAPPPAVRPADGAWAPGGTPATRPAPHSFGSPTPPAPSMPPPADLTPRPPVKPENFADGPKDPFRAPPASLPNPNPPPVPVPKITNPADPKQSTGPARAGANFALRDSAGNPWEFATSAGTLTLLDFTTTTCIPCKKVLPVLTGLQTRYGAHGLDVVAVLCDPQPLAQRVALAAKYHRENNLNYLVYTEDAVEQGQLFRRFALAGAGYPFVVLLDASGAVLWKGNPADRELLEGAIRQHIK